MLANVGVARDGGEVNIGGEKRHRDGLTLELDGY